MVVNMSTLTPADYSLNQNDGAVLPAGLLLLSLSTSNHICWATISLCAPTMVHYSGCTISKNQKIKWHNGWRPSKFEFEIVHQKGKLHNNADAPSRIPYQQCEHKSVDNHRCEQNTDPWWQPQQLLHNQMITLHNCNLKILFYGTTK